MDYAYPMALAIILFGMSLDHVLRMLVTLNSQYYRSIELPEASFGLIGSAVALIGIVVPRIARAMSEHFQVLTNVTIVIILAFISLWGITFLVPYYGMLPMILVFITMMLTSFFTSTYLNKIAEAKQRATVLSYKGLAFNAAYGIIGLLYGGLIVGLRGNLQEIPEPLSTESIEDAAFNLSLGYFPGYLAITLLLVSCICFFHFRSSREKK